MHNTTPLSFSLSPSISLLYICVIFILLFLPLFHPLPKLESHLPYTSMAYSSSSNHNWLTFSLSNPSLSSPSDSSQLCLFEALSASTHHNHSTILNNLNILNNEFHNLFFFLYYRVFLDGSGSREDEFPAAVPKLEDFLGGGAAGLDQLSAKSPAGLSQAEIYESELKTIAASFLRGFFSEPNNAQKQQPLALTPGPSPKKSIDTFGQRTSIYRGVTR